MRKLVVNLPVIFADLGYAHWIFRGKTRAASVMSPFRPAVLALVIAAHAYAATSAPVLLTGSELRTLCTIDASTLQICVGYIAGISDELEVMVKETARTPALGLGSAVTLMAPCPGKQMSELIASTLKELNARPNALNDSAIPAVESALHPRLGCGSHPPEERFITLFADGARLKGFCIGSDRNERLQCEGYIRAVADTALRLLNSAQMRSLTRTPEFKSCTPTWQTPDQAVDATIVYLNAHPEQGKAPASTLIEAALSPPSCPLTSASPASPR
jgi:Rap1a immunity proteins